MKPYPFPALSNFLALLSYFSGVASSICERRSFFMGFCIQLKQTSLPFWGGMALALRRCESNTYLKGSCNDLLGSEDNCNCTVVMKQARYLLTTAPHQKKYSPDRKFQSWFETFTLDSQSKFLISIWDSAGLVWHGKRPKAGNGKK